MKLFAVFFFFVYCLVIGSFTIATTSSAFVSQYSKISQYKTSKMAAISPLPGTNFCDLPGDPSLILTTNVDLGNKKLEIMKGKKRYRGTTTFS